jgi:hypothetical protein
MVRAVGMKPIGTSHTVLSRDGTRIGYLSVGGRPSVLTLAMERLAAILPLSETKEFPILDHFGVERTAPREVAKAVSDYFLK